MEIAYLAGLIDGDGSIMIFKERPTRHSHNVRLDVAHSNKNNLKRLQKIWGGNIVGSKRAAYHLIWNGTKAIPILKQILFYSKFKTQQIGLALLYLEEIAPRISGNKFDQPSAENIYLQMKQLKQEMYAS